MKFFVALDRQGQWLIKDLGRAAIWVTAAILHVANDLTVGNLVASTTALGVASAGRVNQLVRRGEQAGQFIIEDGPGGRTRRRARLGRDLMAMLQRRAMCDMRAAVSLDPELGEALPIMESEDGFASVLMNLGMVSTERRDLFSFRDHPPLNFFFDREAGMSILFDLMVAQAPDRQRLLEEAPLSRYGLSQRHGVSRAHINKLLAESGHTEALGDRVVFSEALSDALERNFALVLLHHQVCARMLLDGWRYRHGLGAVAATGAL